VTSYGRAAAVTFAGMRTGFKPPSPCRILSVRIRRAKSAILPQACRRRCLGQAVTNVATTLRGGRRLSLRTWPDQNERRGVLPRRERNARLAHPPLSPAAAASSAPPPAHAGRGAETPTNGADAMSRLKSLITIRLGGIARTVGRGRSRPTTDSKDCAARLPVTLPSSPFCASSGVSPARAM
jgi:hypothetical protein